MINQEKLTLFSGDLNPCVRYEAKRIFADRLIKSEHIAKFVSILNENIPPTNRNLSENDEIVFASSIGHLNDVHSVGKPLLPISRKDFAIQLQKAIARYESEVANFEQVPNFLPKNVNIFFRRLAMNLWTCVWLLTEF